MFLEERNVTKLLPELRSLEDIYKSLRSNRDVQEEDLLYVTSIVRSEEIVRTFVSSHGEGSI